MQTECRNKAGRAGWTNGCEKPCRACKERVARAGGMCKYFELISWSDCRGGGGGSAEAA